MWKHLRHQNILPLIGVYTSEAYAFPSAITMFLERGSLRDVLRSSTHASRSLDRVEWVSFLHASAPSAALMFDNQMVGVADALAYMHKHGIIHGDITPVSAQTFLFRTPSNGSRAQKNVLVDENGKARISGFTLSRHLNENRTHEHAFSLPYASPQVLQDERKHQPDDVYSFACLCYTVSTFNPGRTVD
jgi:serine/threonine protein kinase